MATNPFGDPQAMALMGLAQGLLSAGAPQPFPTSLGGALSQGIGGALNGAMGAQRYNLSEQQIRALQLANTLNQGKADFYNGVSTAPAPASAPSAAAGPTTPGFSPASSQAIFGTPEFGTPTPPSPTPQQTGPGGIPLVPGLNPEMSRAAALGWLSPGYVSAVAGANSPTEFQKIEAAAKAGDPNAQAWVRKNTIIPPVVNRGFGLGTVGPNGEYIPDLASEGQIARTTAAKAGAEASQRTVEVTLADGSKVRVPESSITQPGGGAKIPSAVPQQVDPAFADIPKLETPKGMGQSTYQNKRMADAATIAGELTKKASDAAAISNERLVYNTQALGLLDKATTGTGALSIANVKNFLNSRAGIPLDLMDKVVAGDSNATTSLNKDLLNAATQKAKQAYGSRITQSEVMLQIKQASPNVDQMTATIRYLLQTDSAMSKYQIDKAQYLGGYLKNGGDPYQFEGFYAKKNPMSASIADVHLPSSGNAPQGAINYLKAHPETKDAFKAKYGYLP